MKNNTAETINVFDYTDYRVYLSNYYKFNKKTNPAFSYRYFAHRAGISSSGFYKEVIDGKRGLTRSLILKFSDAIGLSKKESEYFENMVYYNEAKSVKEQIVYFKKMKASYESKAYRILGEQYDYFSKWYYSAIRELLSFYRFKDDYKALAKAINPGIREDQAKRAIQILVKLKLIRQDGDGFYVRTNPVITTGYPQADRNFDVLNIVNYQKTMLQTAQSAYELYPYNKMDMSTLTMSVSEETFLAMKQEIAQFRKKLLSIAEKDTTPDRIYQLCYNFFPLSKV